MSLGHNDEHGVAYCHLCDWSKECGTMERIEFELQRHLRDDHDIELRFRVEDDTGRLTDIPA